MAPTSEVPKSETSEGGFGRILVAIYAIFTIAAASRAAVQIATKFADAPLAYLLSALAAAIYLLATIALARKTRPWWYVATAACGIELIGVLTVGTLSVFDQAAFPHATVWSGYGQGYLFIPAVLPIAGLAWLYRSAPGRTSSE